MRRPMRPLALGVAVALAGCAEGGLGRIDPDPEPADRATLVTVETIDVAGAPACAFTVRYPGHVDQPGTWVGEDCALAPPRVASPEELQAYGQLDDLPDEARRDILAMTDGVVVVETEFSASAWPLNVAGRIYEVVYAD